VEIPAADCVAARQDKSDLTDDAIVTAVVGKTAGRLTLEVAQLTGQTRKALEPFGAARIRSFLPCWWTGASWLPWAHAGRQLNVAASPGMVSLGDAAVRGRAGVGQARASAFMWFSSVCAACMSAAKLST
jgi:hypothetical protein